jgi:hypothetical protein
MSRIKTKTETARVIGLSPAIGHAQGQGLILGGKYSAFPSKIIVPSFGSDELMNEEVEIDMKTNVDV